MRIRPISTLAFSLVLAVAGPVAAQEASALVKRGAELVNGIVACGNCHTQRGPTGQPLMDLGLSGGMVFDEQPFRAVASNITPDRETGIGNWTDAQIIRSIREGVRPDGSIIGPPMPIGFYRGMSDADVKAIVAWLRAQPAVKHPVTKSEYRMPLPPTYGPPITAPISAPPQSDTLAYGAYLAGPLGHCLDCHTPWVQGRPDMSRLGAGGNPFSGPWGVAISANLTPHASGLKDWKDGEIGRAIREGIRKDGSPLRPPMAYSWYKNITASDMTALIAYLRSLPALPLAVTPPPPAKS